MDKEKDFEYSHENNDEVNMVNDQKCAPVGAHFCCERQGTCICVSEQIKLHEQYVKPFIV